MGQTKGIMKLIRGKNYWIQDRKEERFGKKANLV